MKTALLFLLTATLSFAQLNLNRPRTQFGAYGQRPACTSAIELYLFSDTGSLLNDAICDGSSWHDRRNGSEMKAPAGTWTWFNQGASTLATLFGRPQFNFAPGPGWHGAWLPFTDGTARMCVSELYGRIGSSACKFVLVHEDGDGNPDNDRLLEFGPGGVTPHITGSITTPTSHIQNLTTVQYDSGNVDFQCAQVTYDQGTGQFDGYWSLDGVNYSLVVPVPVMGPPSLQSVFTPKGFGVACDGTAGVPQAVTVLHHE